MTNNPMSVIIKELELTEVDLRDDELWASCPDPDHKDYHPSWSMNLYTGKHHCFSCGFSGHIIGLLVSVGVSPGLARLTWNQLVRRSVNRRVDKITYPITEEMVSPWTQKIAKEVIDRVGTWTIPQMYGVGEDPSTQRAAFITRDRAGNPTGVWVATEKKYVLLGPSDAKVRGALFGAHLPPTRQTVVVEGFYQALKVSWWTGLKTVATMGTAVTEKQLTELIKMAPLVLLLDGDLAGRNMRDNLMTRFPVGVNVSACGGHMGDPDDLSRQEVWELLRRAKNRQDYRRMKKEV